MHTESPRPDAYAALRIPDYRLFLSMRTAMVLANQIMSVAVGYFVYELTNDPLMLGLIGLAEAIPAIAISLYAGHIADKYNRRTLLLGCISVMLLCAVALFFLAAQRHVWPSGLLISCIYAVIFFTGIARGFFSPTNFAFLPQLVDRSVLTNALTWNSSAWEVASITGLGLGGVLYGFIGVSRTFAVMIALYVLSLIFLLQIAPRPVPYVENMETMMKRIKEGLQFVRSKQLILGAIALDLFAVLFGGAVALLPVFAKDILHVGPEGAGILRAAVSIGAIMMGFVLAHRPLGKGAGKQLLFCVACFGLCIIGFGLSRWFWLSFFFLFLSGVFDEVSVFIRANMVQQITPDHLKGRVSSVNTIFITSSNEIGAFESGAMARAMGTVPSVVFGGIMTLVVVAVAWYRAPKLRDLDFNKLEEA